MKPIQIYVGKRTECNFSTLHAAINLGSSLDQTESVYVGAPNHILNIRASQLGELVANAITDQAVLGRSKEIFNYDCLMWRNAWPLEETQISPLSVDLERSFTSGLIQALESSHRCKATSGKITRYA